MAQPLLRRIFRKLLRWLWIGMNVVVVVAAIYLAVRMRQLDYEAHSIAWFVSGVFVLLSLPITFDTIAQHLYNYNKPKQQIKIIRILLMVPVYAVNSWLALIFKGASIYFDTVRECYEAYVLYNFFEYLLEYMKEQGDPVQILAAQHQVEHIWPFDKLAPWEMGSEFLENCRSGVLNYVIVRPVTTVVALIYQLNGEYDEGVIDFGKAYVYVTIINSVSQTWALYCLILFYHAIHIELAPIHPLAKFLCVKFVVFFSFWQSVFLAICVRIGVIRDPGGVSAYGKEDIAQGLQDFLVCIEMFIAAVLHAYSFSAKEYEDPLLAQRPPDWRVMFDVNDVASDVVDHVARAPQKVLKNTASFAKMVVKGQRGRGGGVGGRNGDETGGGAGGLPSDRETDALVSEDDDEEFEDDYEQGVVRIPPAPVPPPSGR